LASIWPAARRIRQLAGPEGGYRWTGEEKFFTRPADLERIWADIDLRERDTLTAVMEPTRNAWAPVAAWFSRRGARVCMVPTTQF